MKTIFDKTTREELINRVNSINENSVNQWGKMNAFMMIKHSKLFDELILGKTKHKQSLIGRIFGKMALKNMIKDDSPMKKNMPTVPGFAIKETETGDLIAERKKWIALIEEYGRFSNHDFVHPFFGKMTTEQIGRFVYKHIDHHLRQFKS